MRHGFSHMKRAYGKKRFQLNLNCVHLHVCVFLYVWWGVHVFRGQEWIWMQVDASREHECVVIWCESRTHTTPNEVKGWGAVEALPLLFGSPHSRLPRTEYECICMDQCALLCWHTLFLLWCVTHQGELHQAALGCKAERVAATYAKLWLCVDAVLAQCCSYVCIFLVTMYIYTGFLLPTFASCHWKSTGLTFCYSPSYSHQAYTHTSKMCRQTRAARWRDYPQQGQPKSRPCCPYPLEDFKSNET